MSWNVVFGFIIREPWSQGPPLTKWGWRTTYHNDLSLEGTFSRNLVLTLRRHSEGKQGMGKEKYRDFLQVSLNNYNPQVNVKVLIVNVWLITVRKRSVITTSLLSFGDKSSSYPQFRSVYCTKCMDNLILIRGIVFSDFLPFVSIVSLWSSELLCTFLISRRSV